MKRLIVTPPNIGLLTGHGERSLEPGDANYTKTSIELDYRWALMNQGFDVTPVSLARGPIPKDVTTLVIADPKEAFSDEELQQIYRYIEKGGNVLVAGEPGRQHLVNPILEPLGVRLTEGRLFQESEEHEADFILADVAPEAAVLEDSLFFQGRNDRVAMPGAAALDWSETGNYTVHPILVSNPENIWYNQDGETTPSHLVAHNMEAGTAESIPMALALTRSAGDRQQRIMVLGDADFMNNREQDRRGLMVDKRFYLKIFGWLSYGEFPIDTSRPDNKDNTIIVSRDGLFTMRTLFMGILPALTLLGGGMLLISRKRK